MGQNALANAGTAGPRVSSAARARWRAARLFQQQAQLVLATEQVPFVQWLLLETLKELLDEGRESVSQAAVANRAGLARGVGSYWMVMLEEFGLVDRGRDALLRSLWLRRASAGLLINRCKHGESFPYES